MKLKLQELQLLDSEHEFYDRKQMKFKGKSNNLLSKTVLSKSPYLIKAKQV